MKQIILTAILTAISVAASIKLSDEGFVGCKNVQVYPSGSDSAMTLQRCFGKLSVKQESVDISKLQ